MSETATEDLGRALPPTAHERALAYESAGDDPTEVSAPSSTLPDDTGLRETTLPSSSDPDAPSAASPDSSAPSDHAASPDNPSPDEPSAALPDNSAADSPATSTPPTLSDSPALQGTPPLPRMRIQNGLRLRMKVWTDPGTLKRYLMPTGFMRDLVRGQPVSDAMYAYAMSDDDTRLVELTATEWNSLPFFYFQEDGYAPRAAARPMDILP
jgi:hypothetical protein